MESDRRGFWPAGVTSVVLYLQGYRNKGHHAKKLKRATKCTCLGNLKILLFITFEQILNFMFYIEWKILFCSSVKKNLCGLQNVYLNIQFVFEPHSLPIWSVSIMLLQYSVYLLLDMLLQQTKYSIVFIDMVVWKVSNEIVFFKHCVWN